jgi:hypothetical protein
MTYFTRSVVDMDQMHGRIPVYGRPVRNLDSPRLLHFHRTRGTVTVCLKPFTAGGIVQGGDDVEYFYVVRSEPIPLTVDREWMDSRPSSPCIVVRTLRHCSTIQKYALIKLVSGAVPTQSVLPELLAQEESPLNASLEAPGAEEAPLESPLEASLVAFRKLKARQRKLKTRELIYMSKADGSLVPGTVLDTAKTEVGFIEAAGPRRKLVRFESGIGEMDVGAWVFRRCNPLLNSPPSAMFLVPDLGGGIELVGMVAEAFPAVSTTWAPLPNGLALVDTPRYSAPRGLKLRCQALLTPGVQTAL